MPIHYYLFIIPYKFITQRRDKNSEGKYEEKNRNHDFFMNQAPYSTFFFLR